MTDEQRNLLLEFLLYLEQSGYLYYDDEMEDPYTIIIEEFED